MPSRLRIGAAAIAGRSRGPRAAGAPRRRPIGMRRGKLVNPVAKTPESETGSVVYAKACANCHGPNGLGNGRLAAAMAAYGGRPSNLTDSEWQHGSSDGEIFRSATASVPTSTCRFSLES